MSETIKPCPFCGGPASVEEIDAGLLGVTFGIGCDADELDCPGYQSLTTYARRADAIKAWNRRPDERAILESAIDRMGWPEINAFRAEMTKGQDYREDAGGYFMRGLRRLFGLGGTDEIVTHQQAAKAMVDAAEGRTP